MSRSDSSNMPMISVIVPMFNVEAYLIECLDSLAAQDFVGSTEVIVIDDCSTDDSLMLCRDWMQKAPPGFVLIENGQNQGVSVTRNRGLEHARGKYFMFVDPDDVLPADALSSLIEAAESSAVDIVKGNNVIFGRSGERPASYNVGRNLRYQGEDVLTVLYEHDRVRGHPWGKLFRRDRLGAFRFPVGVRMAQDLLYCSEVFAHARSLLLIDRTVYRYRNRDSGSTGSKFRSGSYLDWLNAVEKTAAFATRPRQLRGHRQLLLRTATQLARECRHLPVDQAAPVLVEIEALCERWQLQLSRILLRDRLGLRSIGRYLKLRLALAQARRTTSVAGGDAS